MISPYVRRHRLASELTALRIERGWSAAASAVKAGISRPALSRLENGHVRPDIDQVMRLLRAFQVDQATWERIVAVARQAQESGWWSRHEKEMGSRQALCANLECGARRIREYQMTLIPGLLQTIAYALARTTAGGSLRPPGLVPERALDARATRQQLMLRDQGPSYHVVIDELAIRRRAAPADVVADQLDHLVCLVHEHPGRVTIQVLPVAVQLSGLAVPHASFFTYDYPEDSPVVVVNTDTDDHVYAGPDQPQIAIYRHLFAELSAAAMPADDTLLFLADAAQEIRVMMGDDDDRHVRRVA